MVFRVPVDTTLPGGGGGGWGEGGGGGDTTSHIQPPAPRDVRAKTTAIGEFNVSWKDYDQADWQGTSPFSWSVRYCSASQAGNPGDPFDPLGIGPPGTGAAYSARAWILHMLYVSKQVGSTPALGHGARMSLTHREDLPDGYVLVVGTTGTYVGPPSYPIYLRLTAESLVVPDVGTVGPLALTITKERVPRDVLRVDGQYGVLFSPTVQQFAGVHPHVINYDGVSTPREVGPMARWDGSNGIITFTYRVPVEPGQASGTAQFTHGSANVVWVSGDTFSAGYVGRRIIADLSATVASATYVVQTYTNSTHIALNAVFFDPNGVGGIYQWKIFSNSTWYFVPIGKSGARVGDYTTAPSLSL
jgi:hypothetical protein